MANNKKKSWRDDPAGGAPGKQGTRDWQRGTDKAGGGRSSRRPLIIIVGGLFAIVAGYFIWLMTRPGAPPPPALVLIGAPYELNTGLPPNAGGRHALDDLEGWAGDFNKGKDDKEKLDVQRADLSDGDPVEDAVTKIKAVADPKKYDLSKFQTAVIFISAHGGADERGAYLYFDRSNPASPGTVYRMEQALKVLQEKLPADANKLLVLDVTSAQDAWDMRMLHNDFVRALEAEPRRSQVKNLYIIVSSSADQPSWRSDVHRRSIFAHYAVEGLKGAAADRDIVTPGSLYDYVKDKVSVWARQNRSALQEPRLLCEDKDRAYDAHKCAVLQVPSAYKAAEPPGAPDCKDAVAALWQKRDELAKAEPHPWVYTPHLWRRYLDMSVRCEELLRLGDDEAAGRARDALNDLARRITEARSYRPRAVGNSLALGPALGLKLSDANAKKVNDRFAEYQSNKDLPPDKITELIRTDDLAQRPLIRARVTQRLLEEAVKSEADLTRACAVLEKLAAADDDPLPTEANLALFINRRAVRPLDFELVKLALAVEALAEQAAVGLGTKGEASAPDLLLPWLRSEIVAADKLRRDGQDKLFFSADKRADARQPLEDARAKYEEIIKKAAVVREALDVTSRAEMELPYLTHWRSGLTLNDDDEGIYRGLVTPKEKAWKDLHALRALLAEPGWAQIDKLAGPTADVKKSVGALRDLFTNACGQNFPAIQRSWVDIDDLLRCPLVEKDQRVKLVQRLNEIGKELNDKGDPNATAPKAEDQEKRALAAATRQGKLALALLGKDAPEDARNAVEHPQEGQWWMSFRRAGERVGDAFQTVGRRAETAAEAAHAAPPDKAVAGLRPAVDAARLLSGAADEALFAKTDPFDEMRRAALHELFVAEADRAFQDYWAGLEVDKPYYRAAGRLFVASARERLGEGSDLKEGARAARFKPCADRDALLAASDLFAFIWDEGGRKAGNKTYVDVVDEAWLRRTGRVEAPKDVPAGTAVLWPEPQGDRLLVGPFDPKGDKAPPAQPERLPVTELAKKEALAWRLQPRDDLAKRREIGGKQDVNLRMVGFYRGHDFDLPTTVRLHNQPEVESLLPSERPKSASLAVVAEPDIFNKYAVGNSQLCFVLDGSGSMVLPQTRVGNQLRFDRAKEALLATLPDIPSGVTVSLVYFYDDPSKIETVWEPKVWDAEKDVKALTKVIDGLPKPNGGTPLVRSLKKAKELVDKAKAGTAKTIVVLTDGGEWDDEDGGFRGKPQTPRKEKLVPLIEAIFPEKARGLPPVQVAVIGFELGQGALHPIEAANLPHFKDGITRIGGKFFDAENKEKLKEFLAETALRQLQFRIDQQTGESFRAAKDCDITLYDPRLGRDQPIRWVNGLEGGATYLAVIAPSQSPKLKDRGVNQDVKVAPGDFLLMRLVEKDGKFAFERQFFQKRVDPRRSGQPKDNPDRWQVGLYQPRRLGLNQDSGMQMLAVVEQDQGAVAKGQYLRVPRPTIAWFRTSTETAPGKQLPGLKFYPVYDYPAPAWVLGYAPGAFPWPPQEKPVVDVWWQAGDNLDNITTNNLSRGERFNTLESYRGAEIDAGVRGKVVIESVTQEERVVEVAPDKPDAERYQKKPCLVVRLRWPAGSQPFFVMLRDKEDRLARGHEHRFYTEAGRYTGVFWDVDKKAADELSGLRIMSVESLTSNPASLKVEGLKVGSEPDINARRPQKATDDPRP
jgi:hypothetical protein